MEKESIEIFTPDQTESFEACEAPTEEYCVDKVENPEVYDTESHELDIAYTGKSDDVEEPKSDLNESFSSDTGNNESYEAMEIDETVRSEGLI